MRFYHLDSIACQNTCALVLIAALALAPDHGYAQATVELMLGNIQGVLVQDGKPVPNALVLGCASHPFHRLANCKEPFETRTDSDGRFIFRQRTGISQADFCKVCPCVPGKPLSCDPSFSFGFAVLIDGRSAQIEDGGLGLGKSSISVKCQIQTNWQSTKDGFEMVDPRTSTPAIDLPNTRKLPLSCRVTDIRED